MKFLAILAFIVLLVVAAMFYFGSGELAIVATPTPGATDAAAPKSDFTSLATLLLQDMTNIPVQLDAPRAAPANAFSVKSRLEGAGVARPEYQTLAQACELIIYADKEHSVRQRQDQEATQSVTGDPMATEKANQLSTSASRTTLHDKAQAEWAAYRAQTDTEVRRLLASLSNAK